MWERCPDLKVSADGKTFRCKVLDRDLTVIPYTDPPEPFEPEACPKIVSNGRCEIIASYEKDNSKKCPALLDLRCRRIPQDLAANSDGSPVRSADCPKKHEASESCEMSEEYLKDHSHGDRCPECGSTELRVSNIKDIAPSILYVMDEADFDCEDCGHKWNGSYGYWGIA